MPLACRILKILIINFGILNKFSLAAAAPPHGTIVVSTSSPYDTLRSLKFKNSTINTATPITVKTTPFAVVINDLLCNNESEFVCICQHNTGNLLKHYILCNQFIEVNELPIIEMNIRRVNLTARLHTNETYESYFKRRVAAVVSNYCQQQADECMATTLRLKKENVVILSVKKSELQSTTVGFVITKSQRRSMLNAGSVLDSIKVKYILSAQLAALSRILGGVRIERVETIMLGRYGDAGGNTAAQRDNTRLLIILSIVATFLIVTYTIAAVRVCRDCNVKKHGKQNSIKLNKATETPNYGTCVVPKEQAEIATAGNAVTTTDKTCSRSVQVPPKGEIAVLNAYQMTRMFQCDPSQLPAEESFTLSQTSNDPTVMRGSKSLPESAYRNPGQNDEVPESSRKEKEENLARLQKQPDETGSPENIFIEIPQKYAKTSAKIEQTAEQASVHKDANPTNYFFQKQNEYSEGKITKPLTSVWNRPTTSEESLIAAWIQPMTTTAPMNSAGTKEATGSEQLRTVWNQRSTTTTTMNTEAPPGSLLKERRSTTDEPAWLLKDERPLTAAENPSNSISEKSDEPAELYDEEIITLELHAAANAESESEITPGTVYLKRVSLADQPNYLQNPKYSNFQEKGADESGAQFIQKSNTAHRFDHWSSESDGNESDAYHKLSELEDASQGSAESIAAMNATEKTKNSSKNPQISENEGYQDLGIDMDLQSSTYTGQFTTDSDEPYYERLQESPVTPNSFSLSITSDELITPQQIINSSPTDDVK